MFYSVPAVKFLGFSSLSVISSTSSQCSPNYYSSLCVFVFSLCGAERLGKYLFRVLMKSENEMNFALEYNRHEGTHIIVLRLT